MDLPTTVKGKGKKYTLTSLLASGDIADVYETTTGEVVKVTRDRADNDLLLNEAYVLNYLRPQSGPNEKFHMFLPQLLDWGLSPGGFGCQANLLKRVDDHVSFADIIAAYPSGIDFQDMVWMYKRLLTALGYAHIKGVIHGAVLPAHILVHPTEHGAILLDWCYALNFASLPKKKADPVATAKDPTATPTKPHLTAWELLRANLYEDDAAPVADPLPGAPPLDPNRMYIRAISVDHEHFYAPEILKRATPTPATDLFMAAKTMVALLGGDVTTNQVPATVPTQIRAFLSSSLLPAPEKRPQDAWDLHEAFDKLLRALVGPPKYRPFSMP